MGAELAARPAQSPMIRLAPLLGAAFVVSLAYGVTLPILPDVLERMMGGGRARDVAMHTGWLTGAYTLALLLLSPLWGELSDRIGRRIVILIGLVGSAASLLLLDAVSTLTGLYAARLASGALSAAVLPAVLAYVGDDASSADEQPRRFASVATATTLGFLIGPLVGGAGITMATAARGEMRPAGVFMIDSPFFLAAISCLTAAAAVFALSATRCGDAKAPGMLGLNAPQTTSIQRSLLLTGAVVFGITAAEVGVTLLARQPPMTLGPGGASAYFVVCGVMMIVVQTWVYPRLARARRGSRLLSGAFAVMAVGLALIVGARTRGMLTAAFVLSGGGVGILIPALALRVSRAAVQRQGRALGRQAAAANLGQALAAASTGALFAVATQAPFLVAAAVLGVAALLAARE